MTLNKHVWLTGTIVALAGLILESTALNAENIGDFHTVSGIVEHADENTLVIKNKPRDITGALIIDNDGEIITERGSTLKGKVAIILYQKRQPISVAIVPFIYEQTPGRLLN